MNILAALARAYDHLPDAPRYGFSSEKISFCVVLNPDGSVTDVVDLRDSDKKRSPRMMVVPQAIKRTRNLAPNFLWDKTSYVLGVTADKGKSTAEEHATFRNCHMKWLANHADEGLLALTRFLENYTPDSFKPPLFSDDILDQNLVFALSSEYRSCYLHDRPAARKAWQSIAAAGASVPQICLVSGVFSPVARLHPSIKGVWGAQSSGASLVSFNLDAFTSYDHEQGDNAPVSEATTFAYTTALNRFLEKDSGHRIQIGDASTVFWAEAKDRDAADEATALFVEFVDPSDYEKISTKTIRARLDNIRNGKRLSEVAPKLAEGVRFYVLGLAPNAARLSVRFYWENDFGQLATNYQRYLQDTKLDPPPLGGWPPLWCYLREMAVLGKLENVPPNLAGDWMRAILTGEPYPQTLLSTALMRMRSDGKINSLRVAIIKSVLKRNLNLEVPVALDTANTNMGYILGRLFAVYEEIQRAALGDNVNTTIKDRFYGSASATPQRVFAALSSGSKNHFTKLKRQNLGRAVNLEKLLISITDLMIPEDDPIPISLTSAEQALFGIGYYHQRSFFFRKHDNTEPNVTETSQ